MYIYFLLYTLSFALYVQGYRAGGGGGDRPQYNEDMAVAGTDYNQNEAGSGPRSWGQVVGNRGPRPTSQAYRTDRDHGYRNREGPARQGYPGPRARQGDGSNFRTGQLLRFFHPS